ncbi:MFS transporter, partial [Chloroflexota bacterium]
MFVGYAIRDAFPLFYVQMLDEFGRSRAETALISSISFLVYGFSSAISGAMLDRLGPRKTFTTGALIMGIGLVGCSQSRELWQIFIFWGVIFSFGVSAVGFVPCMAIVSKWFTRRRATAVGITQAGGRESLIMAPVTQSLILALGWRSTYLMQAVAAVILITLLAQFLRRPPEDMGLLDGGETSHKSETEKVERRVDSYVVDEKWVATNWTLLRAMKEYRFWVLLCLSFTCSTGYGIILAHQVAFMVDVGFTAMSASFILLIYGIIGSIGRLFGFVSDIVGREITYSIGCAGIIIG